MLIEPDPQDPGEEAGAQPVLQPVAEAGAPAPAPAFRPPLRPRLACLDAGGLTSVLRALAKLRSFELPLFQVSRRWFR